MSITVEIMKTNTCKMRNPNHTNVLSLCLKENICFHKNRKNIQATVIYAMISLYFLFTVWLHFKE